jgi:hypothetical protein
MVYFKDALNENMNLKGIFSLTANSTFVVYDRYCSHRDTYVCISMIVPQFKRIRILFITLRYFIYIVPIATAGLHFEDYKPPASGKTTL